MSLNSTSSLVPSMSGSRSVRWAPGTPTGPPTTLSSAESDESDSLLPSTASRTSGSVLTGSNLSQTDSNGLRGSQEVGANGPISVSANGQTTILIDNLEQINSQHNAQQGQLTGAHQTNEHITHGLYPSASSSTPPPDPPPLAPAPPVIKFNPKVWTDYSPLLASRSIYFQPDQLVHDRPIISVVCPVFSESGNDLRFTLLDLYEMQRAVQEEFHPNLQLHVLVVMDGWSKAPPSLQSYVKSMFATPSHQKPSEGPRGDDQYSTWEACVNNWQSAAGDGEATQPETIVIQRRVPVDPWAPNPYAETHVDEVGLQGGSNDLVDGPKLKLTVLIKRDNRRKHNAHDWFINAFAPTYSTKLKVREFPEGDFPRFIFMTDAGTLFDRSCLQLLLDYMIQNSTCVASSGRQRVMTSRMQECGNPQSCPSANDPHPCCEGFPPSIDDLRGGLYRGAQGFEYEASVSAFNGVFHMSGMLPVLPGPCQLVRLDLILDDPKIGSPEYLVQITHESLMTTIATLRKIQVQENDMCNAILSNLLTSLRANGGVRRRAAIQRLTTEIDIEYTIHQAETRMTYGQHLVDEGTMNEQDTRAHMNYITDTSRLRQQASIDQERINQSNESQDREKEMAIIDGVVGQIQTMQRELVALVRDVFTQQSLLQRCLRELDTIPPCPEVTTIQNSVGDWKNQERSKSDAIRNSIDSLHAILQVIRLQTSGGTVVQVSLEEKLLRTLKTMHRTIAGQKEFIEAILQDHFRSAEVAINLRQLYERSLHEISLDENEMEEAETKRAKTLLKNSRDPCAFYFGIVNQNPESAGLLLANLMLAEDRIFSYAVVVMMKHKNFRPHTAFVPNALFYFAAETEAESAIQQIRRWTNGTVAGFWWLLAYKNLFYRRLYFVWVLVFFQILMYAVVSVSPALWALGLHFSLEVLFSNTSSKYGDWLLWLYLGLYAAFILLHSQKSETRLHSWLFHVLTVFNMFVGIVPLVAFAESYSQLCQDGSIIVLDESNISCQILSVAVLTTLGLPLVLGLLYDILLIMPTLVYSPQRSYGFRYHIVWTKAFWNRLIIIQMIKYIIPFYLYLPTKVSIYPAYSFSRIWELTWGNKPSDSLHSMSSQLTPAQLARRSKDSFAVARVVGLGLLFINLFIFIVLVELERSEIFLIICTTLVLIWALIQQLFSLLWILYRLTLGTLRAIFECLGDAIYHGCSNCWRAICNKEPQREEFLGEASYVQLYDQD